MNMMNDFSINNLFRFAAKLLLAIAFAVLILFLSPYVVGVISGVFGYFYFLILGEDAGGGGIFASILGWIWLLLPVFLSALTFAFYLYFGFPKKKELGNKTGSEKS